MSTAPPLCWAIRRTVASPRPVPEPGAFVVKNGSKIRARIATSMPLPVSVTATATWRPGAGDAGRSASDPKMTSRVAIVSVPSGLWTPMVTSEHGSPVASVTIAGCVSPGNGDPSSWIACQRGSTDVRPAIWPRESPRIASALALQASIVPSAAWRTTPSDIAVTTER